jgi:N-acetylneuraminic acid mutarotase
MFRFFSPSLTLAAVVLASALGAAPAQAQQNPTGAWAQESGAYFYYGAAATNGTYIYLFGGYQPNAGNPSGDAYRTTRRYDPVNNVYQTMADLPQSCYLNSGVFYLLNNVQYLYSFGNGYQGTGAIYRYDIAANSWTTVGNLTGNRYGTMAAVLGTKVFIAGGYFNGYSNACDEFDPANNTSTGRATMPGPSYMGCMAAVPALDKAFVIGGYNNGYINTNYEFTPPAAGSPNGTWNTRAAMVDQNNSAAPRGELPAAFSVANRVYVAGGYTNNGPTTTLFEYLPTTNTWAQRASMTYQRYYAAATALNNKGYVFGGGSNPTTAEEYTPPAFGSPPNIPTTIGQIGSQASSSLQAQADSSSPDGWTNNQMQFSADISDPDAAQTVRLRVQVKPQSAQWSQAAQVTTLQTALGPQGVHTVTYTIPADNGYDWRWRIEDAFANSYPVAANAWVEAFGTEAAPNTNSPDFRSDQLPPTEPVALAPHNADIQVGNPVAGGVTLYWQEATDNGPVSGISYEIQAATDGGFNNIEAQLFSTAGTSNYPVTLSVSRFDKFWRIRARDVGGNLSAWSPPLNFRVTYNDGEDHGGGDSAKSCGFTAAAAPALSAALMGLALVGFGAARRRIRKA